MIGPSAIRDRSPPPRTDSSRCRRQPRQSGDDLRLRKLAVDYDPCDRISALTHLQQRLAAGEIVTGLLFVEPDSGDLHDFLDTVETPLNHLGETELCLGPEALARFNAAHR